MTIGRRIVNASGWVVVAAVMPLAAMAAAPPAAASAVTPPTAERVLVIDQEGPTRPAFVQFMDGLRAGLAEGQGRCDVFIENLDLARLDRSAGDPERAAGWLVAKYSDWSFDVIVPTSVVTRDFVLANRERLSPAARIVSLDRPGDLPASPNHTPDYTSVTTDSTMGATVELACQLLPQLRRVALVSQSSPHPGLLAIQMEQARTVAKQKGIEFLPLVDLPLAELRLRLRELPPDSAAVFGGYWKDEAGRAWVPADVLESLCRDAPVPFFGIGDTYVGRGIVGGMCADTRALGEATGRLVVASRDGPLPAPVRVPPVCLVDERVLARFGIPPAKLPARSKLLFREPRIWDRYWPLILGGAAAIALQAGLIAALVAQSRLRRRAERIVGEQRDQIAHAGRVSMLGQLAASLAHELGQPLGAILNNVEAATLLLRDDHSANAAELRAIVDDIADDDERAGAVLERIRAMVRRQRFAVGPVEVPGLIRGVVALAGPGLAADRIGVTVLCDPAIPRVAGDEILLQQALLNLVGNSADAIRATAGDRQQPGAITIRARRDGNSVELAVIDNGGGIEDDMMEKVLEPFETTKKDGLGMGLPIVRAIAEQHDGTLRLANDPGRGLTASLRVPAWRGGRRHA
ncbi:MAG: ATP-binding protein [Pirellulales bacterium]